MLNFTKFAQAHNVSYIASGHHHCHQGWLQLHCPVCTDGRHGWHLGFNLDRGNFNCWRCGSLKRVDVMRGMLRVSKDRAIQVLRKFDDGRAQGRTAPKTRRRKFEVPPGFGPLTVPHRKYLKSRGFGADVIREWDLQGTRHLSGKWNWRVVYPICNELGMTVAFQGRAIHPDTRPKYRMTEDDKCLEDPRGFLYGINKVPGESVIVVEGSADVWAMGPGTVGTFGIDWKTEQANRLRRFQKRFIMFDPDRQAQRAAQRLAEWLSYYPGETEIVHGLRSDPGSLDKRQRRNIRKRLLGRRG